MNAAGCTNEDDDDELKSWHAWIGSRVCISGTKLGTLRYFGKTHFAEGSWCGVELDEAVGKNNGTVKDVRYFTCKANFGIFAPLSKTEKITDVSYRILPPVSNKSKLPQSKSKLKFAPLQSELPKPLNETVCLNNTKSHLPYQSNANDAKININEVYKKHRKSESFLEKKSECDFYRFNNNNNSPLDLGHLKIAERKTSTPVASPFKKHPSEQMIDFLNKTVTLDNNGKISYSNQESFAVVPDNCVLNTTFDLSKFHLLDNDVGRKENTFVFENANMFSTDYPKRPSEGCIDSEEDPKSSELEESLGILSLSQMKDFTLSFDNNSGTAIQVSPKIRKMESCDDVNEIPEFEENKISQELPGGSHNMLINMGSENVLKKIINPVVQTFELLNVVTLDKNNIVDQDDNTKSEVEHFNSQDIENLTPKESSAVKDSFIEFHSLDNVNLNVSPSATSTPTFTPLKFSKVPLPKPVKCNSISSSVHSPFTEQAVCLTPLNQTFNGDFFEQNLPMPKTNVISKPSNDVDQVNVKVSDAETHGFKLDNFESELSASCKFIANALSYETNTSTKDIIANITLDTSSSNLENKQPVLSKTKVLSNLIPFDDEREVSSKSSNSEILEKKHKVNSFCSEIISDSKYISDIVEDDILTSEIASNKNEATRVGELRDTDVKVSNHVKNAVCPMTNPVLHITSCNADNAVTVPSDIEAHSLQFNTVPNSTSIRDELINATTHTVISEIPVDLHLEETEEIVDACDSQLCPADEINSVASNDSILIENKSECLTASSREKGDSELEDENTNKLSETFSCSTLKELDNFETACNEFHTEESDVERNVLDVTVTVMQMDNLNVTVNIDQLNQISNATYNKSDSVHSKSNASNDGSSNGCLLLDNAKKSDVKIVLPKAPQKNIISKIKSMLESDKNSTDANQENQKSKQCGMSQKKMGKWDSVTSKIAAGLTDNKKKVKKEITSRVNTNLNASRQTISKSPQPSSATKWPKSNVSRKSETGNKSNVTNNRKNSLDNKMIREDSKSLPSVQKVTGEREKDSRILVQLQNTDCEKKHSKTTKVNLKKGFGLFSKTTAVSRSNSLSSDCSQSSPASKNVLVPKTSTPVQTKALNGSKKTVTPKTDAGSNKRAISGKNNKELPTHRPQTTSKFISKSSLVNEVKFLRNLCETRKKEIDVLEFVFQRAHLGFNALIVLLKHIIEHYDPFSQQYLANAHENMKAELQKTVERLFSCQKQLESIEKNSIVEVGELAEKLCCLHLSDMNDLKLKHSGMLKQMDLQHKKEIRILKENFQHEAVRQKENYEEVGNMLKENHKKQICELEERYQVELTELKQKYEDTEESLNEKISQLVSQCNSLREEFILMEEKLMRDKNKTIQAISAEKTKLQKDVESLHAVIEIKNIEIRKIKNKMIFLKEKENELYEAKKQIKIYESQIESLQAVVTEKNEKERKWELRCKETEELLRNQKTLTRDMLMNRDQVRYKLGLYMERNSADATYLSGNIMTANRSNSLDSLPVSKCKLSTATTNYQPKSGHSMSLSWHPHEPIHEEENSSKEHCASFMTSASTLQNESQLNKECNLSFLQKMPLKRSMNRSQWSSENIAHFYVRLDDGQFSITPSEDKKSEFVDCKLVKPIFITSKENEPKINDDNHSSINHSSLKSDVDLNADKSASGAISLQSSYTSDSSNSNFIVHPESEESSSCSQRSKDNDVKNTCEHMLYDDLDPLGVKNPRNLAGEAMIQDINTILPFSKQLKSDNREELSQMEDNFSSPEESKEKINNQVSIATPSLDTLSSQGMADSTNLDVSWGDEEILSD